MPSQSPSKKMCIRDRLGRSFVTLEYQSTRAGSKGLFALDNLWDGLGALTVIKPNVKYFFKKKNMTKLQMI